jgi:hypothetical protein
MTSCNSVDLDALPAQADTEDQSLTFGLPVSKVNMLLLMERKS